MKLTKGALTMLLAQYRAIYKNAFIKGLASAALATAVLASGSAGATTKVPDTGILDGVASIDEAFDKDVTLTLSQGKTASFDLAAATNLVKAKGAKIDGDLTVSAGKFLNLDLSYGANGKGVLEGAGKLILGGAQAGTLNLSNLTTNLSNFTLDFGSTDTNNGKIVVGENADVEFNYTDIKDKLTKADGVHGFGVLEINKGTLKLNSETAIAIDDTLLGQATNGGIKVDTNNESTLEVKSGTLAGTAALQHVGEKKLSVKAQEFAIGTEKADATAASKLKDITVSNKLTVTGATAGKLFESVTLDGATGGTIEGKDTTIQSGAALNISQGNWTSNVDITLGDANAGTLTIGNDKDTIKSSLNFADGKGLTLTKGTLTVQNSTLDLTKYLKGDVTANVSVVVDTKGQIDIDSANLTGEKKLLTSKIKLDNGGVLNVTDDFVLEDATKLVSGDAVGILITDGTLQGNKATIGKGDAAVAVTLADKDKSKLKFDSYTFKAVADSGSTINNKATLDKGTFISKGDITVTDGTNNGVLVVGGTNGANLQLNGAGTVNATKLELAKGSINVKGAWTVDGKFATSTTDNQTLTMEAGSSLAVNQLATGASAALTVSGGELNVVGTDKTGDIALESNVKVDAGTTLIVGAKAVDDILTQKIVNGKVVIEANDKTATKITANEATATLKLTLDDSYVFTKDNLTEIKGKFKDFHGFLDLGSGKYEGEFKQNAQGRYNYADVKDFSETGFTNDTLTSATVETKSSDAVTGSYGSIYVSDGKDQSLKGPVILNKAGTASAPGVTNNNHFITDKDGKVGNAKLADNSELVLKNGGEIGNVTLEGTSSSLLIASGTGKTVVGDIAGAGKGKAEFGTGAVSTGAINVQDTKFTAGSNADVKSLTTKNLAVVDSSVKVAGDVTLTNDKRIDISKSTFTTKNLNLNSNIPSTSGSTDVGPALAVLDGSSLIIDGDGSKLTGGEKQKIAIGYAKEEGDNVQLQNSYGSMFVKDASEFKGAVSVSTGLDGNSSIAVFGAKAATETGPEKRSLLSTRATTSVNQVAVNFDADAGKNGVLAFGYDSKDAANKVLVDNGLLTSANGALGKGLKSIALVNSKVVLNAGKEINLDGSSAFTGTDEAVKLGQNSAIVLTNEAFENKDKPAIQLEDGMKVGFDKLADADKNKEAKILLAGKFTVNDVLGDKNTNPLKIFGNKLGTGDILNNDGLQIETVNGLLKGTIGKDGSIADYGLADNYRGILYQASSPVAKYIGEYLSGTVASTINEKSTEAQKAQANFFDTLITTTKGLDVEQAARYAVYGGTVKAAELASKAGSEAILAYVQGANTVATAGTANGSIFVVPTYKSSESDSFGAEGVEYGTDIKLKGVSLGADFAINPNFKLGAMFNIGTGDADGKSIASGIESDVDYVGGGLFATFENGALRVVSDITYTDISSDVKSSIGINNYTADSDASVLSLGVNGEYKFDLDGSYVTPHAGVRYSKYDIDDVTVKANGKDFVKGSYDSMSVVSIPFGVTVGTDMLAGDWMLQPSLDLGVTFNIGDTDVNHSAIAFGAADGVGLTSEILDDVVFGIKGGLKASYNNLSIGLGLGYEVGSNADDLSVQASGVYTF